jgi:hypothetical protein
MAAICAEAASKVIDIEKVYIKPQVRELIEKYLDSGRGAVRKKN